MPFAFPTPLSPPKTSHQCRPFFIAHQDPFPVPPTEKKKPNDWDWHYHHSLSAGGPSQSHQTRGNDAWVPAAGKFAERGCYVITINLLGSPLLLILLILLVLLLGCGRWGQPFGYETATTTTTKQSKKKGGFCKREIIIVVNGALLRRHQRLLTNGDVIVIVGWRDDWRWCCTVV